MLSKELFLQLEKYINSRTKVAMDKTFCLSAAICFENNQQNELTGFIKKHQKLTFNHVLFAFIDKKGARDIDIYKRAGIDRRHFSKIRSNPDYRPGKNTVIALALALELDKSKADKLLHAAGYSLSDSDTFDLVIQFCLEKSIYEIYDVNLALDYFSLKPLAGVVL